MHDVKVERRRSKWYVLRDGAIAGWYSTPEDAENIAQVARYAEVWPPESGTPGVRFYGGKWQFDKGGHSYRYTDLDMAIRERERMREAAKKPKRSNNDGCAKCVWRLVETGGSTSGVRYHCGYSLCLTHHSRVWLHYQRTGRESLEGMTHGSNCTEFMPGNPRDKLSLMQDNPAAVTAKGWALLAKEAGKPVKPEIAERRRYITTVDIDMDKANQLRAQYKWREIATAAGISIGGAKGCWERQRINRQAAKRLLDAYGVDITKNVVRPEGDKEDNNDKD